MKLLSKISFVKKTVKAASVVAVTAKCGAIREVDNISYTGKVVHAGRALSAEEINQNRSSKYNYLAF